MKNWIEEHPYLTGSLVLGGIVLFFLLRGSSGSNASQPTGVVSSGPSESLQAAQLSSATQLQESHDAATVAQNQTNAAVATAQIKANSDVVLGQLASNVQLQNIVTSGQVQLNTNATALQSVVAQIGGQVQLESIGANRDIEINKTQQMTISHQADDALAAQRLISDAQTAQAKTNADLQLGIVNSNNSTELQRYSYDANLKAIQDNNATNVLLNNTNAQLAGLANTNDTAYKIAGLQAGVENNAINTQGNITLAALPYAAQAQHDVTNASFEEQQNYINHLGFNLNPPGYTSGSTADIVSAAQPGNTIGGILTGFGNIVSGIARGLVGTP